MIHPSRQLLQTSRLPDSGAKTSISEPSGRYTRRGLAWHELPEDQRSQVYSWNELPLVPDSQDAIVLTNAIHWLPAGEAGATLRRIVEALRPGGALAIIDIFVDVTSESSQFLLD